MEDGASYGLFAANADGFRSSSLLDEAFFRPRKELHLLRVEARGNHYLAYLDGALTLEFTDNTALTPGRVGLWVDQAQLNVHSFTVDWL